MADYPSSRGISCHRFPPSNPLGPSPSSQQQPLPWIALQFPCPSYQSPCILVDLCLCLEYIGPHQGSCLWFSLHSDCHTSDVSLSDSLWLFPSVLIDSPRYGDLSLNSALPYPGVILVLLTLLFFFASFLHPMDVCILFPWPGTPASTQLVLCEIFCIWICIPDTLEIHSMSTYSFTIFSTTRIFSCSMWTLSCGTWNLVPWSRIKPRPTALGVWSLVLVTGPPGKSWLLFLKPMFFLLCFFNWNYFKL